MTSHCLGSGPRSLKPRLRVGLPGLARAFQAGGVELRRKLANGGRQVTEAATHRPDGARFRRWQGRAAARCSLHASSIPQTWLVGAVVAPHFFGRKRMGIRKYPNPPSGPIYTKRNGTGRERVGCASGLLRGLVAVSGARGGPKYVFGQVNLLTYRGPGASAEPWSGA